MDAIEALKLEIRKIRIALGLETESSPGEVFPTKKRVFEEQQRLLDLNNPYSDQWSNIPAHHHHKERQTCGSLPIDPSPIMELNLSTGENQGSVSFNMAPLTESIWKNNRRSWTPELDARFASVLQMLGGPEAATPKQIRDLMQIEELTNNQVKSHLQKYRLNWRNSQENVTNHRRKSKLFRSAAASASSPAARAVSASSPAARAVSASSAAASASSAAARAATGGINIEEIN